MSRFTAKRTRQHNKGRTNWTSQANDWTDIRRTVEKSAENARLLEKKIKARGAERFLLDSGVAVPPEAE